ncbi:MAG: hypothetical protein ACI84C_000302 [Flavobacteriales bacterium]|jgi:hypothetical protein
MKKDEVPQDDANVLEGKLKTLKYATNDDGTYTKVQSVGWEPENLALSQAWEDIHERLEGITQDIAAGKSSPILYYMEKCLMETPMLAQYIGVGKWRVKRHFKAAGFAKLSKARLEQYAYVFEIPVEHLTEFDPKRTS